MSLQRIPVLYFASSLLLGVLCSTSAFGQISGRQASWVLAHKADIANKTVDYIKTLSTSKDPASKGPAIKGTALKTSREDYSDVADLISAKPEEWEFFSRDRGILIAIHVDARPYSRILTYGPEVVAEAAEKVIRQDPGQEMRIAGHIQVVFIEPDLNNASARYAHRNDCRVLYMNASGGQNGVWFSAPPQAPAFMSMPATFGPVTCNCR